MSIKQYIRCMAAAIAICLIFPALLVFVMDPLYHYHMPWFGQDVYLYNEVYQTPGMARNSEYDSAVIGSSMTENFRVSWFDNDFGWETVKLSYEGATSRDLSEIMKLVFEDGRHVENVVLCIDDYQMLSDKDALAAERPEYLYNNSPFDDVEYLWNKDTFQASLRLALNGVAGRHTNPDDAYNFSSKFEFSAQRVFEDAREFRNRLAAEADIEPEPREAFLPQCRGNLENILPYIKENSSTAFYIIYPPYSILNWEKKLLAGTLEAQLTSDAFAIRCFLSFPNVRLFYFQDKEEWITDLDQYMDTCHYTEAYNHAMEQHILRGEDQIGPEDVENRLRHMYEIVAGYDFDKVWEKDQGKNMQTE